MWHQSSRTLERRVKAQTGLTMPIPWGATQVFQPQPPASVTRVRITEERSIAMLAPLAIKVADRINPLLPLPPADALAKPARDGVCNTHPARSLRVARPGDVPGVSAQQWLLLRRCGAVREPYRNSIRSPISRPESTNKVSPRAPWCARVLHCNRKRKGSCLLPASHARAFS